MTNIVRIMRLRKEPTIEVDIHYPQIVDSDVPDEECLEAADEIERLQSIIRNIVTSYDKEEFMRTCDFHTLDCDCLRCAVDAGRKV